MMNEKLFQVVVFGKEGCPKCHALNQRLDKLLQKPEWNQFEKLYIDVLTEEGLIEFCNAECINPQRIPAMTIKVYDENKKRYAYIQNPSLGAHDAVCRGSKLYTLLGLQTDYSDSGIITPKMITSILSSAKKLHQPCETQ